MDLTITVIYCVCEEFSKAMGLRDEIPKLAYPPPRS